MARAVTTIREPEDRTELKQQDELDRLDDILANHVDELEQVLHLVELLQEKGLLDAATAMLEQAHDLLGILVAQTNRPGSIGGIKGIIAILQGIVNLDAKLVSALFNGIGDASQAISRGEAEPVTGVWDIVRTIREPSVTVGMTALFAVLKAVGKNLQSVAEHGKGAAREDTDEIPVARANTV